MRDALLADLASAALDSLRHRPEYPSVISLFSGLGGIDYAFAAAGFDIIAQVEIDEFCRKVLAKHAPKHWPNAAQYVDVRDFGRAHVEYADIIAGGFPCQDISLAGRGAGLAGERSGLWYEFRRIIGEIRPRIVFLENVPAITSRGGLSVVAHLAALGYDARWGVISAADAGAPHQRDRWWCVADRNGWRYTRAPAAEALHHQGIGHGAPGQQTGNDQRPASVADRKNVSDARSIRLQARADQPDGIRETTFADAARSADGAKLGYADRPAPESRMGRDADGLSAGLVGHRWPAGSGQHQHEYEPPRQVSVKPPDWASRIKALGNAVIPQVVYPLACEIYQMIQEAK